MEYLEAVNKIFKFLKIIKNSFLLTVFIIYVDYLNFPTQCIVKDAFLTIIGFSVPVILIIIDFISSKRYSIIIAKSINNFDKNNLMFIISILLYSLYLISDFKIYKVVILVMIFTILLCLVIGRMLYISALHKKEEQIKPNIYDLKEFLEKDFSNYDSSKIILFKEVDVEYDLLNRDIFVNYISSLINCCNPQKSFVFALNGVWGSGKSTILNLVKNKIDSKNMIIIDNFDPWKYNDNKTLFRGFYDSITKNKDLTFDYSLYKKFLNMYKVLILGNDNILNKIKYDIHFMDNDYSVDELKNIVSTYLKINNKKIVYIIDNIDRLNKEQMLIIFKTISTLFDFDNFVYILSFDEERVSKIFKEELAIDPNYLNKIINSSIPIPKTNNDLIAKIAEKAILKLHEYYNIKMDNNAINRFKKMFSYLSKMFTDIRELKRFLNYISAYMQSQDIQEQVNIEDFIIIQLLKYLNIELYNEIYNSPIFFVSEEADLCSRYEYISSNSFSTISKQFYEKLFEKGKNKEYKQILAILFPYVDTYLIQEEQSFEYYYQDDSAVNKRIFDGKYFEHYFELTPSSYACALKEVNIFIEKVNSTSDDEKIEEHYRSMLLYDTNNMIFKLEILNKLLDRIDKNRIINLFDIVYNDIDVISFDNPVAINMRSIMILSKILNIVDLKPAKEKVIDFINKNNNLQDIDTLVNQLNPDKKYPGKLNLEIYKLAQNNFTNKLNNIIDEKIDVITKNESFKYFSFIVENYINIEKIREYVVSTLNQNNIFKFLIRFIIEYKGTDYSYELNEKDLYKYIKKESIDKILFSNDLKLNNSKQRILDIYNKKGNFEKGYHTPINHAEL